MPLVQIIVLQTHVNGHETRLKNRSWVKRKDRLAKHSSMVFTFFNIMILLTLGPNSLSTSQTSLLHRRRSLHIHASNICSLRCLEVGLPAGLWLCPLSAYIQAFSRLTPNCLMASYFPAFLSLSTYTFSSSTCSLASVTLSFASQYFFHSRLANYAMSLLC